MFSNTSLISNFSKILLAAQIFTVFSLTIPILSDILPVPAVYPTRIDFLENQVSVA